MSLIKRRKTIRPEETEVETETINTETATPEDLFALLRDAIREKLREGLQSHDAQDNQNTLCALVDDIELSVCPRKKE